MHTFSRRKSGLSHLLLVLVAMLSLLVTNAAIAGPDVTVFDLPSTQNYGATNGIRGYAVGTTSCNVGNTPLNWCRSSNTGGCGLGTTNHDHPVIGQNMYRIKNGRMDQIGASWLKHGFLALNNTSAGCGNGTCQQPPLGDQQLGIGCTDPYSAGLNGTRDLGRRSEVDATTGAFPVPIGGGGATSAVWNQRVAVAETDLDATNNPGATYYVEGQYIAPDDALAGNGLNNASYRKVLIGAGTFNVTNDGSTVRAKSAIEVWPLVDPTVQLFNVDVPGAVVQRFHVARKVTDLGGGNWHYEYAVHNMNSTRSSDRLTVDFGAATTITGVGFHDVNAHSNEPYDTTDWTASTSANSVTWQAPPFPASPTNVNAIRWGTMYNFWFDATRGPAELSTEILHLFQAGTPEQVLINSGDFYDGFEGG